MSGAQTISSISVPEICHIDFNRLCDNNDFASLIEEDHTSKIESLLSSISDEELRVHVIDAIELEIEKKEEKDLKSILDIKKRQAKLQQECRNHFVSIVNEKGKPDNGNNQEKEKNVVKGLTARQIAIFYYFCAEVNEVFIGSDVASITQKQARESMAALFGIPEVNLQGLVVPNFGNKQVQKDMRIVANIIRYPFPKVYAKIQETLINCE